MLRHNLAAPVENPRNAAEKILYSGWGSLFPMEKKLVLSHLAEVCSFLPRDRAAAICDISGKGSLSEIAPSYVEPKITAADMDGYKAKLRAAFRARRLAEAKESHDPLSAKAKKSRTRRKPSP